MQVSLFDGKLPFRITKPIRLIEMFAGYGSQHFALKYLGVPCESYKICEWAVKSIQAYKDAHFSKDNTDYSKHLLFCQIVDFLVQKGISANYNEPMTREQIKRLGEDKCRVIYNNIKATHNLVNICEVSGKSLEIVDTDKYDYIMTYSFPCQDLSSAGLGKGMAKGSGTRSGMLWEVERILDEIVDMGGYLPQVLVMENVPEVIGTNNIKHFAKWQTKLESLGYKNKWECLNAVDFEIPQSRNRCFMVSILGDYYYNMPSKLPLKLRLKDLLEDNVPESFYLSSEKLVNISKWKSQQKPLENIDKEKLIAPTLTARGAGEEHSGMILINDDVYKCEEPRICASRGRNIDNPKSRESGLSTTQMIELGPDGLSNTLTTVQKDNYVVVPKLLGGIGEMKSNSGTQWYQQDRIYDDKCAISVTTSFNPYYKDNLRIRKLTPKECFRLMGVKDQDFEKIAQNQSNASLYHLAGDSIVVNVLMAIFKKML